MNWDTPEIAALIRAALDEDLGAASTDLTAERVIPAALRARARVVAKRALVLAGLPLAERVFIARDAHLRMAAKFEEGADVPQGTTVAEIEGCARAILAAERTALNFLARLCGIATLTRRFVQAVAGTATRIRDTRKTTPLLRQLEKYAVRVGGGANHRFGLYDAILIKENHVALAGSIAEALRRARSTNLRGGREAPAQARLPVPLPAIQVEVRNEAELREALDADAEAVLLDNISSAEAARLVRMAHELRPGAAIEVSGGVTLANVRAYAEAGADFIAIGALTHSAPAADLTLLVDSPPVL